MPFRDVETSPGCSIRAKIGKANYKANPKSTDGGTATDAPQPVGYLSANNHWNLWHQVWMMVKGQEIHSVRSGSRRNTTCWTDQQWGQQLPVSGCGPTELVNKIIEKRSLATACCGAPTRHACRPGMPIDDVICQLTATATRKSREVSWPSSTSANWRMLARTTLQRRLLSPAEILSNKRRDECRIKNLYSSDSYFCNTA
ncbi:hypothetical protein BX661DRAFT_41546 [Kickxella alabastrina]|uniref:uncharacterized protein n=1 Tax=Kickxella alabastrina TaxID=61397 RepID=UPI00221EAD7C|nr:uncharacterized protein BX661DRAFT_41546 [Kickxella alabastrina]KAI7824932.1 hypothetical protein BX661DRAFT_41546 [Kickxella alabastrina]